MQLREPIFLKAVGLVQSYVLIVVHVMQLIQPIFQKAVDLVQSYELIVVHVVIVTGIATKFISYCLAPLSAEVLTTADNRSDLTVVFYYVLPAQCSFLSNSAYRHTHKLQ